jgi:hypothetical protein
MCFGSHDAQRDNDQSTTGSSDANGSDERCRRAAPVVPRAGWLWRGYGHEEEASVSGGSVGGGRGERPKRHCNVNKRAKLPAYHGRRYCVCGQWCVRSAPMVKGR